MTNQTGGESPNPGHGWTDLTAPRWPQGSAAAVAVCARFLVSSNFRNSAVIVYAVCYTSANLEPRESHDDEAFSLVQI